MEKIQKSGADCMYNKWHHPYKIVSKYTKRTAYFSMEFAIHQGLKTYSGGLGFLAGSHMRSAFELKQNLIGIGILWKYGYYDQGRNKDQTLKVDFMEKTYSFLEDTGLEVSVSIHGNTDVKVRAYVLKPDVFGAAPIYLLSTDLESNDFLSRTITDYLYDANEVCRVSQSIVLGVGGAKIVEALGGAEIYHLNEGHGLPAFYHLKNKDLKVHKVFTTHTPEKGGNEERNAHHLNHCGFFGKKLSETELRQEITNDDNVNYTAAALKMADRANAVSKLHAKVSQRIWQNYRESEKIIPITNAQNQNFWQDKKLQKAWKAKNAKAYKKRKQVLKGELFEQVLQQTGKIFDREVATIVWARRFAEYKRADLLLYDWERFIKLVTNTTYPVQIIWSGKPYPLDDYAIGVFNRLVGETKYSPNLAVLTGYELELSAKLKKGSDIWLNTPRITHEASGTSGMSAAMNGSVNVSTYDGWIPEFAKHGKNSFVLPEVGHKLPEKQQDEMDCNNLYDLLEKEVLPIFYEDPMQWNEIIFRAKDDVIPKFSSNRLAQQYYKELYH